MANGSSIAHEQDLSYLIRYSGSIAFRTGLPDLRHYVGGVCNAVSFSNKSPAKFDRKSLALFQIGIK